MQAAALAVISRDGYAEATEAAIANEAGISEQAFRGRFAGKQECFVAAYDAATGRLLCAAGEAAAKADPGDRARAVLGVLLGGLAADPGSARACMVEVRRAGREALAAEDRAIDRLGSLLAPGDDEPARRSAQLLGGGVWEAIRAAVTGGADVAGLLDELDRWVVERRPPGAR